MIDNFFKGLITAVITPFKDNRLDFVALEKIIEFQIVGGVDSLLMAGSTGEGNTLTYQEYAELINASVKICKGRVPIIASCCSSSTAFAKDIALVAQNSKVDGLMCTVPPYVKPTQKGIYQHFKTIHDATHLPIMLYNPVSRAGIDIEDDTLITLSLLPRIMAIKDASGNLERPLHIRNSTVDFNVLAGDDVFALAYNAQGANGLVSVASNVVPELCKKNQLLWERGDIKSSFTLHQALLPLYKVLFVEPNPIPVKYAVYKKGLCDNELRLPLINASAITMQRIDNVIMNLDQSSLNGKL